MATSSVNTISALGAGSGVDVKSLAQSLVDAEKTPRKDAINAKIKKSEGGISGYGAIKFVLGDLKTAFSNLKDLSDFGAMNVSNSQSSAFSVTTTPKALAGSHTVSVSSLAAPQRNLSAGFADTTTQLTPTTGFSFTLTQGPVGSQTTSTINIGAGDTSLDGIVSTINAYKLGITAQVVNTGSSTEPYKIMLTGDTGTANQFTITAEGNNQASTLFGTAAAPLTPIQAASNATATIDGIPITSSTNRIDGVIAGVTFDLNAKTNDQLSVTGATATVNLSRDTTGVKANLQALVKAYNGGFWI